MDIQKGTVVISLAGRDKGRLLAVWNVNENGIFVVDGKERRLSDPKRKNPRHLTVTDTVLSEAQTASDSALRKSLAGCSRLINERKRG